MNTVISISANSEFVKTHKADFNNKIKESSKKELHSVFKECRVKILENSNVVETESQYTLDSNDWLVALTLNSMYDQESLEIVNEAIETDNVPDFAKLSVKSKYFSYTTLTATL